MNITAMIGAASQTDRAIVRSGLRHSPAWIATYSNPPSAPNPILGRSMMSSGSTSRIAFLNRELVVPPRIRSFAGTVAANSTSL